MEDKSIFSIYREIVAEMTYNGSPIELIVAMTEDFDKSTSREQALETLNCWKIELLTS